MTSQSNGGSREPENANKRSYDGESDDNKSNKSHKTRGAKPNIDRDLLNHGFIKSKTLDEEFSNENRTDLYLKYLDMGDSVVVGRNPNRFGSKCYFIFEIAGPNGYEANSNYERALAVGDRGTKYYTIERIIQFDNDNTLLAHNSSPRRI